MFDHVHVWGSDSVVVGRLIGRVDRLASHGPFKLESNPGRLFNSEAESTLQVESYSESEPYTCIRVELGRLWGGGGKKTRGVKIN